MGEDQWQTPDILERSADLAPSQWTHVFPAAMFPQKEARLKPQNMIFIMSVKRGPPGKTARKKNTENDIHHRLALN